MATTYTQRTYTQSDQTETLLKQLQDHLASKPGEYDSRWMQQLDDALNQILNRPAFSYDAGSDPLYRQYQDFYVNQGRQAMMDTLGQAAALTGGYGNSYGQIAGQQVYQGYLQELNQMMPELYQLALDTYDRQNQALMNRYGAILDREALDYGRYSDNYGLWADQRDYLADQYDSERSYDYTQFRDLVGDDQWMAQFAEDIRRFDFENKLGEFASMAVPASGSKKSYSGAAPKKKQEDEEEPPKPKISGTSTQKAPHIVLPNRVKPNLYTDENY